MNCFIKISFFGLLFCSVQASFAQMDLSSFTISGRGYGTSVVKDYQSIGINPAGLGYHDNIFVFGMGEASYSLYSQALAKDTLRDVVMSNFDNTPLTIDEKRNAAKAFTNTPIALDASIMSIGFSVHSPKFGGIGFAVKERIHWYSSFGSTASQIIWMGKHADYFSNKFDIDSNLIYDLAMSQSGTNYPSDSVAFAESVADSLISEIMAGSKISASWVREWNVSYGKRLIHSDNFGLYAGVGLKYIQGFASMEVSSNDDGSDWKAEAAFSPDLPIQMTKDDTVESALGFKIPESIGGGFGIDFGINAHIGNRMNIGLSVNDIGNLNWNKGKIYVMSDDTLASFNESGVDNYNLANNTDEVFGGNGPFVWDSLASRSTKLPGNFRAGLSVDIIPEKFQAGIDFFVPIVQSEMAQNKPVIGGGIYARPIPWLMLSAGVMTGGNYGFQIPLGITLDLGGSWEFGVASKDAVTFLQEKSSTLSMAFGFLRFKTGPDIGEDKAKPQH